MSFQFPRKPEKQAFSLLKCRIKNKLLHVAVSAFHTPPRDSPKKCDKWHIWQFVAPLASSSQQPHPRTSSVAGKAHQAGRPATHTTYQATPGYSPPPEKHASVFGFSTYGYLQFWHDLLPSAPLFWQISLSAQKCFVQSPLWFYFGQIHTGETHLLVLTNSPAQSSTWQHS